MQGVHEHQHQVDCSTNTQVCKESQQDAPIGSRRDKGKDPHQIGEGLSLWGIKGTRLLSSVPLTDNPVS